MTSTQSFLIILNSFMILLIIHGYIEISLLFFTFFNNALNMLCELRCVDIKYNIDQHPHFST